MTSTVILSDNGASSGSAGLKSQGGNDGVLILQTTTSGGTATNAVYIDNAQNVGYGITPSAWRGILKTIQLGNSAAVWGFTDRNLTVLSNNVYQNSAGTDLYINNGVAQRYSQDTSGNHTWVSAASGTAGGVISATTVASVGKDTTFVLQGGTSSSGTGIAFPASQSASSDANTLDDYEEGTFTPTVIGTTTAGTATYATRYGTYVKVGKSVTFTIGLQWSGHTGTGNMYITGLPFTANGSGGVASRNDALSMNANSYPMFSVEDGSTQILCAQTVVGTSNGVNIPVDAAAYIIINGTYITTA